MYVFDAYRPQRAVKDFAQWFRLPVANDFELERKKIHYPQLEKADLIERGYVPDKISRHNFGYAIDLTLMDLKTQQLLDMGACFDYFDELSHDTATAKDIGDEAYKNRQLLTEVMQAEGYTLYPYEYWHFDFHIKEIDEPMDLPINVSLKGLNVDE